MLFVLICLAKRESLAPKHALADYGSRRNKGIDDECAKNLNVNLKLKGTHPLYTKTRSASNIRFNFQFSFGFKSPAALLRLWTTTPSMQEVSTHVSWNPMSTFPRKPSGYAGARVRSVASGLRPHLGLTYTRPERWRRQQWPGSPGR